MSRGARLSAFYDKQAMVRLSRMPFTAEEKERWARILHDTWHALSADAEQAMVDSGQRLTKTILVEIVCDANRPEQFGMTQEEYRFMSAIYSQPRFQQWARRELNY